MSLQMYVINLSCYKFVTFPGEISPQRPILNNTTPLLQETVFISK